MTLVLSIIPQQLSLLTSYVSFLRTKVFYFFFKGTHSSNIDIILPFTLEQNFSHTCFEMFTERTNLFRVGDFKVVI